MKRSMLILLALSWAFSNPSLAAKGYEFSDEQKCEIVTQFSTQLQDLSLLLIVRFHQMIEDEKGNIEPFAHSAKDYFALLDTIEKAAKIRKLVEKDTERVCDED